MATKREKLHDLMRNQEAKRTDAFRCIDTKELRAMQRLAHRLFGRRSMLEMNPGEPGVVYVGIYATEYPPSIPCAQRARKLVLRGRTYAELVAQAKVILS